MTIVEKALLELNTEILNNLTNKEANAKSVTPKSENIIKITPEKKELGFVGNPKKINKEVLLNIVTEKKVPIVAPMGVGDDGKIYNINADVVSGSIAKELNSRRLLLMTDVEGVLDKDKNLISEIDVICLQHDKKEQTGFGKVAKKHKFMFIYVIKVKFCFR